MLVVGGLAAATVAKKVVHVVWVAVTGRDVPSDPNDPRSRPARPWRSPSTRRDDRRGQAARRAQGQRAQERKPPDRLRQRLRRAGRLRAGVGSRPIVTCDGPAPVRPPGQPVTSGGAQVAAQRVGEQQGLLAVAVGAVGRADHQRGQRADAATGPADQPALDAAAGDHAERRGHGRRLERVDAAAVGPRQRVRGAALGGRCR